MARRKKGRAINGVFLLDKAEGLSSNGIMQRVKRLFNAQKAGHTGALDPLATGMLPVCLGEATKFSQFLLDADKKYRVTAKLGERTDSSDATGEIISRREVTCDLAQIQQALENFRGDILQTPTMFSALKYQGKPLYEYARKGIDVPRPTRPITIFELTLVSYQAPYLTLDVHCSKGTYIRTLVDDLGELLGCGAHVTALRRTAVADFPAEKMLSLDELEKLAITEGLWQEKPEQGKEIVPQAQDYQALDALLLPCDAPVARLPAIHLTAQESRAIQHGQRLNIRAKIPAYDVQDQCRLFNETTQQFLGVAHLENGILHPERLVVMVEN